MSYLEDRSGDRRTSKGPYIGLERRKSNYDRRRLPERRKLKPPMSPAGRKSTHDAAYVASLIADIQETARASHAEVNTIYGAPRAVRTSKMLRGLTVDRDIT